MKMFTQEKFKEIFILYICLFKSSEQRLTVYTIETFTLADFKALNLLPINYFKSFCRPITIKRLIYCTFCFLYSTHYDYCNLFSMPRSLKHSIETLTRFIFLIKRYFPLCVCVLAISVVTET